VGAETAATAAGPGKAPATMGRVFRMWLPLAASWALMGAEGPTIMLLAASTALCGDLASYRIVLASRGRWRSR
jgi:hypothetical protein